MVDDPTYTDSIFGCNFPSRNTADENAMSGVANDVLTFGIEFRLVK